MTKKTQAALLRAIELSNGSTALAREINLNVKHIKVHGPVTRQAVDGWRIQGAIPPYRVGIVSKISTVPEEDLCPQPYGVS